MKKFKSLFIVGFFLISTISFGSTFNKAKALSKLTPLQYQVTQNGATEKPFANPYWNNKEPGIYVDVVSGQPLFSSTNKYASGTGWPSFTKPITPDAVKIKPVSSYLFYKKNDVSSSISNSHLGDVFKDGPKPTGLRYCINSASLKFIHKKDMVKEGYGKYMSYVKEK